MHNLRGWKWTAFSRAVTMFLILLVALSCESQRTSIETDTKQTPEKVQYTLKFVRGQSYDIRIISDSVTEAQQENEQDLYAEIHTGLGYLFDVNSVDDQGNATVDCTVSWVMYKQKSHGGTPENQDIDYDSSDKSKQTIPEGKGFDEIAFVPAKVFRALLNEKFLIKMTPRGQVLEIRGLDTFRKNIEKKAAERSAANESNWAENSLLDANDVELTRTLKQTFLNPLGIYPDRPVSIGDSWTGSEEIAPGYKYEFKWTLKERKAGVATIDIDRATQFPQWDGPPVYIQFHGQIEINESTGRILYAKTNENISTEQSGKRNTVIMFKMTERKPSADR